MLESAYFIVERVHGSLDPGQVQDRLHGLHGVSSVSVDPRGRLMAVDYDSAGTSYDQIENTLNKLGYQIAADASRIHIR